MEYLALWLILALVVAFIGQSRKIGFVMSFIAAVFLSPLIGIIIVFGSERNSDIAFKEAMLRQAGHYGEDKTEQQTKLDKLKSLYDAGVLSEMEYEREKAVIMKH